MRQPCQICAHDSRVQMDSALQAGLKISEIATRFGVSKHALGRHKRRCIADSIKPKNDSLGAQVELWLQRANDLWATAGAERDVRGQTNAITQALRALEFLTLHANDLREDARGLPDNLNLWTEAEGEKFRAYLDKCIADAAKQPWASDEVKVLAERIIQ